MEPRTKIPGWMIILLGVLFVIILILVIDDFRARGETIRALVELVKKSGAALVGIGAVIEKRFEGGRSALTDLGVPIETLAVVTSMDNGKIELE